MAPSCFLPAIPAVSLLHSCKAKELLSPVQRFPLLPHSLAVVVPQPGFGSSRDPCALLGPMQGAWLLSRNGPRRWLALACQFKAFAATDRSFLQLLGHANALYEKLPYLFPNFPYAAIALGGFGAHFITFGG
ncbi:hypothetical protein EV421DRAFT_1744160 [Armillaria borealis]|uniref:Uncharacterized protein n=1 Tax=Armillaria borealis TaxID=47425 RepID=A0AA39IW92_9AGAR|nr:hypothetical protein EV421DRAFT_1744160 [Armillaria borealis]